MSAPPEPVTLPRHITELSFITPVGTEVTYRAALGPDIGHDGPLRIRHVTLAEGWTVVQDWLPADAAASVGARERLDREVAAAVALTRATAGTPFDALFLGVVGYALDVAEPYLLYQEPRGVPLTRALDRIPLSGLDQVTGGLAVAIRLLELAGFAHRAITPDSVTWDGGKIQLGRPVYAERLDRPRWPAGLLPYASPEQRAGVGLVDARDDVWSLAQVAHFALVRRPGDPDGRQRDLPAIPKLRRLTAAFAPLASDRPTPVELLAVLGRPDPALLAPTGVDPVDVGRKAYDQIRIGKGPAGPPAEQAGHQPAQVDHTTRPTPSVAAGVPCPYCLETITYDPGNLFTFTASGGKLSLDLRSDTNPRRRADAAREAWQRCPGTTIDGHAVPAPYLMNGPPLTVALVGDSAAGKTHVLAAMIGEIERGGLDGFGLSAQSVNRQIHDRYLRDFVQPLLAGKVLDATRVVGKAVQFADALVIHGPAGARPVAFFDIAGEELARSDAATRFLAGVGALLFLVDPRTALQSSPDAGLRSRLVGTDVGLGDRAFGAVLDRLPRAGRLIDPPAVLLLSKADLVRYEPPVDRWLSEPVRAPLDPVAVAAESRDVFAFLHRHGALPWLKPYRESGRCTLHVVSASGGDTHADRFPRGARSRRVLQPLISLFAMAGLLGPEFTVIGR